MSRLIDADVLIERIYEYQRKAIDTEDVIHSIKTMPTAYDIEKVVAELKTEMNEAIILWDDSDYYTGRADALEGAIEIVLKGEQNNLVILHKSLCE